MILYVYSTVARGAPATRHHSSMLRATQQTRKLEPVGWRSAGARQRVHEVVERDGAIYVRIGTEPPRELPSDAYARRPPRNTA